jgi:hypothetical protein
MFQIKNTGMPLWITIMLKFTLKLNDGYFKFCVPLDQYTTYGWIDYEVSITYNNEYNNPRQLH